MLRPSSVSWTMTFPPPLAAHGEMESIHLPKPESTALCRFRASFMGTNFCIPLPLGVPWPVLHRGAPGAPLTFHMLTENLFSCRSFRCLPCFFFFFLIYTFMPLFLTSGFLKQPKDNYLYPIFYPPRLHCQGKSLPFKIKFKQQRDWKVHTTKLLSSVPLWVALNALHFCIF